MVAVYGVMVFPHAYLGDDALITLTFVKNLVQGNGWVYNHPPPVLATTTPLFTLILAGIAFFIPSVAITRLAVLFSGICWVAIIWLFYTGRKRLGMDRWEALLIGFLITVGGWSGLLGMELYFFTLLLLISILLYLQKRYLWAGLAGGLLFLTRGEGILLMLVLGGCWLGGRVIRNPGGTETFNLKPLIRLSLGFLVPLICWTLYAWPLFGNILPGTLGAKLAQGHSGIWPRFFPRLVGEWMPRWSGMFGFPGTGGLSLWYPLILVGLGGLAARWRRTGPLVLWGVAFTIGYTVLGVAGYSWYGYPVYFVLLVVFARGVYLVCSWLSNRKLPVFWRGILVLVILLLTLGPLLTNNLMRLIRPEIAPKSRTYHALARWMDLHTLPEQTIAYFEIGYLGYYTDNRIFDLVGLTSPEVLVHVSGGDFTWGFWETRPHFLIYKSGSYFQSYVRDDPRFAVLYQPVKGFSDGNHEYIVFRRLP